MDLSPQQGRHNINLYRSIEKLSRITSIGPESVVIFKDLLGLRNSVFHNQDIDVSAKDARKFVDFAMLLNSRITNATRIKGYHLFSSAFTMVVIVCSNIVFVRFQLSANHLSL